MRWLKNKALRNYMLFVVISLGCIALYLFLFAQNRYSTNSIVVVKQVAEVEAPQSTGLSALLGVSNTSGEDAQFLKAYIESRDLVEILDRKLDLRTAFSGNFNDPIFQLKEDASKEELIKYYKKRVNVSLDEKTLMLTINTEGFDPAFSLRLNRAILEESERFINEVSQRVAKEQLTFAETQFQEATDSLSASRENLLNYQNESRMFNPETEAAAVSQVVAGLESNVAQLKTEERTLLSYLNPTAPQVVALRSQIRSVLKQIEQEKSKLTSASSSNRLNRSAADFKTLESDVEFSVDLYKLALASLEKARLESARKLKNLVTITSPQLAQDAMYPRRGYILFSSFLLLTMFYGIIMLIVSVIREHKE